MRLAADETVLLNGATGTSGQLARRIAKHHATVKVIATSRNPVALQALLSDGADRGVGAAGGRESGVGARTAFPDGRGHRARLSVGPACRQSIES